MPAWSFEGQTESDAPVSVTLLEVVSALTDVGASDSEVVAAVLDLVASKRVRLVGQIVDCDLLRVV